MQIRKVSRDYILSICLFIQIGLVACSDGSDDDLNYRKPLQDTETPNLPSAKEGERFCNDDTRAHPSTVMIRYQARIPKTGLSVVRASGVIIADHWVLTAAHVLDEFSPSYSPSKLIVGFGPPDARARFDVTAVVNPELERLASDVVIHPDYDKSNSWLLHDIALIKTEGAAFPDACQASLPARDTALTSAGLACDFDYAAYGRANDNALNRTVGGSLCLTPDQFVHTTDYADDITRILAYFDNSEESILKFISELRTQGLRHRVTFTVPTGAYFAHPATVPTPAFFMPREGDSGVGIFEHDREQVLAVVSGVTPSSTVTSNNPDYGLLIAEPVNQHLSFIDRVLNAN